MENITHALYMTFAMLVFAIAFTYALYMLNNLNETTETLVYRLDETNYYDSLDLTDWLASSDSDTYKIVGIDSIIPTLYRYYKESFCVKILDKNGDLLQLFDTTTEEDVNTALSVGTTLQTDKQKALLALYNNSSSKCYLYGAPWIGNTELSKQRIDMYISGAKGYINSSLVDYSGDGNYLNYYSGNQFKEIFSQYSYEGDTLTVETTDDGVAYETLTGTKQTSTKIVITYQLIS